jgi:type II secretory pathway pseudopilin PulG
MIRRTGSTLIEQVILLAVLGGCAAVAFASGVRAMDTAHVHGAAQEVVELFAFARDRAMATGTRTAVRLDVPGQRLVIHADTDTLARLELQRGHAVRLESTRDSMAYLASGLGFGAANLRIVLSRGASRDTILVSRLGRVRR